MSAIKAFGQIAHQTIGCAYGRIANALVDSDQQIPSGITKINVAWVRDNLARSLAIDSSSILDVSIQQLGSQTTARCIAHVRYAVNDVTLPTRLFIKSRASNLGIGVFGALFELGHKEVRFYRDIKSRLTIETPKAYIARARLVGGDFVLALEDLSARSVVFKTVEDECSLAEAELAVDTLAALHSRYWNGPELESELGWLDSSRMESKAAISQSLKKLAYNKVLTRFASILDVDVLENKAILESADIAVFDYNDTMPQTFLHGDPHLGNTYFVDGRMGLLDWQVIQKGFALKDLAYYLIVSLPYELRKGHDLKLVERYVGKLSSMGIALDLRDAILGYRINAIHPFLATVVTAAAEGMQTPAIVERSLRKTSKAVVELGLIDYIKGRAPGPLPGHG